MAIPQSHVNNQLFGRLNTLESKVDAVNGYLKGVVDSHERLIVLFTKALYILGFIAAGLLFTVIYGALGERGFRSIRDSLPAVPQSSSAAIPAYDDLDKWRYGSV